MLRALASSFTTMLTTSALRPQGSKACSRLASSLKSASTLHSRSCTAPKLLQQSQTSSLAARLQHGRGFRSLQCQAQYRDPDRSNRYGPPASPQPQTPPPTPASTNTKPASSRPPSLAPITAVPPARKSPPGSQPPPQAPLRGAAPSPPPGKKRPTSRATRAQPSAPTAAAAPPQGAEASPQLEQRSGGSSLQAAEQVGQQQQQQQQEPQLEQAAGSSEEAPKSDDYGMPVQAGAGRMVVVDALPLLYKAHFAFPADARLRNGSGLDTTVVYVFLNMLLNLLSLEPPPTHLAVVFDAAGKNFRHELYPDYKGQRPDMPAEIREAIPLLRQLLQALGLPVFSVAGVEADDVLGTLAVRGVQEGMVVALASPDKDFFQLLRWGLILLRPPKKQQYHPTAAAKNSPQDGEASAAAGEGSAGAGAGAAAQQPQQAEQQGGGGERRVSKFMLLPYTEEDFKEEWGLTPTQFIDLLALAGDASDNVPGVPGIGPKTATSLLQRFGSLEELLARAGEVGKKPGATLQSPEGAAAARLSRQLVKIETGLDLPPLKVPLEELRLRPPQDGGKASLALCRQLELRTHEERLRKLWEGPAFQQDQQQQQQQPAGEGATGRSR